MTDSPDDDRRDRGRGGRPPGGGNVRRGRDDRRRTSERGGDRRGGSGRGRDEASAPRRPSLSGKPPPPRRAKPSGRDEVPKPSLPAERPQVPGGVYRDIKRTARKNEVEDVASAVGVAGEAMVEGDVERAIELLTWAGSRAPRSTAIREGLGVALYLAGRFEEAQRELQAYRRISGRADQNHLLADCARALGRTDKVIELLDELMAMHEAGKVEIDRVVEAVIVQAGIRADAGDHEGALATLERAPLPEEMGPAHARAWYAAGDIAEQMGDPERAKEYFEAVTAVEEDFLDVQDRIAALGE